MKILCEKKIMSCLLIVCVYGVGIYLVLLRMMQGDLSAIPGDLGDARLNNYFLEHGYKWITGQVSSFWNAPFFYPATSVMSFSDNHLGTLPIYSFFRFLHFDRETSYQLWFFALFTLNYFSCVWVLRKISINAIGAAAGAYIFTFSLPVIAQIGHSQLLPRFMIPLAFYFAFEYFEKPGFKTLALVCLAVVVQFYCTIYMGFFLVLGLLAWLIAFHIVRDSQPSPTKLVGVNYRSIVLRTVIVFLSIVSLLPLIIPYYATSLEYGMPSWSEIAPMLPRIKSYLYPASGTVLWHWLEVMGNTLPMSHEHRIFTGALPLLGFALMPVFYMRYRRDPLVKKGMMAFITTALLILLTLYVYRDFSLYQSVSLLPGMRALRAVTRVILLMLFPFSVMLAIIFHYISDNRWLQSRPLVKIIIYFIVLFVLVLDQYVSVTGLATYSKSESQNRLMNIEKIMQQKGFQTGVFAYMPDKSSDPPYVVHIDAMMVAQNLNMATVNGYSGGSPMHYDEYFLNYDRCGSFLKWKEISIDKYGKNYKDKEIFADFHVVGRDVCRASLYEYGKNIIFVDAASENYLGSGWGGPESTFRWSEGKESNIKIPVKNFSGRMRITITVNPAIYGNITKQRVKFILNNKYIGELVINIPGDYSIEIDNITISNNFLDLNILYADAMSPADLGLYNDQRVLALAFSKMKIEVQEIPNMNRGPQSQRVTQ